MNLIGPVGVYNYQQKLTVLEAGTATLRGHAVHRNQVAVITEACITVYTGEDRKMLIGKTDSGDLDHVVKILKDDTGHSLELNGEMILIEDEAPYAVVFNPDVGDKLYVTFHGMIYQREG